ncbi:MAG: DUF86 domain-containing protein [Candidatus Omnitrophica bacterium]|nr:DUF86 domain-containing protein [Candidatus Omnitrophota bacterium]
MVDLEIVRSRLDSIREMLDILRRHQKLAREVFLSNRDIQLAVEHAFFIAIQSLLDLGSHILADMGIKSIADYRDVILKLGEAKVLPSQFTQTIVDMAGFRNRLIHEYQDTDPRKIYEFLQNRLGDFEEFMRHIRDHFHIL